MSNLITTVGLPRSGKSTWAKQMASIYGYPFVNLDSVRLAIHGTVFDKNREKEVIETAKKMVKILFYQGYKVIMIDDCNIRKKHRFEWLSFLPNISTIFRVFDTSKEECVKRAMKSKNYLVPVIKVMSELYEPLEPYEQNYFSSNFNPARLNFI